MKNSQLEQYAFTTILFSFILASWSCTNSSSNGAHNKKVILSQFQKWEQGKGSLFDILADDVTWKIAGTGPGVISGTYHSKAAYIDQVVNPIQDKLANRLSPKLISILAEGDNVVIMWQGHSTAMDGKPYYNTYSWHLTLKNDRIVNVTAFLDTYALNELMERVHTTGTQKNRRKE